MAPPKGFNYKRPNRPPAENNGVDPAVKWVWHEMQRQKVSQNNLAKRCGFSSSAIRNWFQGRSSPEYSSVRAMINALGYDLQIIRRDG